MGEIIGLLVVVLTAFFAVWQFRQQKEWEKKYECYSQIIDALYDMSLLSNAYLDEMIENQAVTDERVAELQALKKHSEDKIWRLIYTADLIVPREVLRKVRDLLIEIRKSNNSPDFWGAVTEDNNAIFDAIESFSSLAREDLRRVSFAMGIGSWRKSLGSKEHGPSR